VAQGQAAPPLYRRQRSGDISLLWPIHLRRDPALEAALAEFIIAFPALIFSLVAHEYAHAVAAWRQGDDTAYMLGRITLNPLPHLDPFMSVLVPALTLLGSGGTFVFGGAKPVPVTPRKYRNYRRGDIIVSLAGVSTNFVLSFVFAALFVAIGLLGRSLPDAAGALDSLQRMMMWGVWLNLLLCFFNLIPIPPLDGSHVLYHFLPPAWGQRYRELHRFGFLIVMLVIWLVPGLLMWLLTPARFLFLNFQHVIVPFALGDGWRIFGQ
jgi:Zn-dependent protease